MGVVNVTPDSFSDGGEWFEPSDAITHGLRLTAQGADLVDVGGESTRPGAERPSEDEELRRVLPVVRELASAGVVVSIDTMRAEVARQALALGPGWSTTSPAARRTRRCSASLPTLGSPW